MSSIIRSSADRRQIESAIRRATGEDVKKISAQQSIPYERIWPEGVCRVNGNTYTKTMQFQDVNYQLAQKEDKEAIFEGWCDFLNYFDSSVHLQLTFVDLAVSDGGAVQSISIPLQGDGFDDTREEYSGILQRQLAKGNNGLAKTKYLTFGCEAASLPAAS